MIPILSVTAGTALALIIHELGHLVAARSCKVSATKFGLGLGPRLVGFRLGGISLSLRALPLGSFVMLDGSALKQRSVRCNINDQHSF